jgi:hypothetical protein
MFDKTFLKIQIYKKIIRKDSVYFKIDFKIKIFKELSLYIEL